jgi:hypothetical protein
MKVSSTVPRRRVGKLTQPTEINPRGREPVRCVICKNTFRPWRTGQTICLRDHSDDLRR